MIETISLVHVCFEIMARARIPVGEILDGRADFTVQCARGVRDVQCLLQCDRRFCNEGLFTLFFPIKFVKSVFLLGYDGQKKTG